jgi:hypothetical protein
MSIYRINLLFIKISSLVFILYACQSAYDVARYGIKMDEEVLMITQKRAYTNPIWYTPER